MPADKNESKQSENAEVKVFGNKNHSQLHDLTLKRDYFEPLTEEENEARKKRFYDTHSQNHIGKVDEGSNWFLMKS